MRIFVINLARNRERRESICRQLREQGLEFEVVEGVDGARLSEDEVNAAVNRFRWWCSTGLAPRKGEVGCALSHAGIYAKLKEKPACILEDDAVLTKEFAQELGRVEAQLDGTRPQVVLLSNFQGWMRFTDGYVLTPKAARVLLRVNTPLKRPCDHWSAWVRHGILEVSHWEHPVISQTFATTDTGRAATLGNMSPWGRLVWKAKRLVGLSLDEMMSRM